MNLGLLGAIGGLGQGISNLGQTMMKDIESREADERQRVIDMWKLQMQEEYAIKREEREAARTEAENKRTLGILMASDENARKTLAEREFEKFKRDLGQTDATDEQLRQVFEQQYFDQSVAPGDAQSDRYNPLESGFIRQQRIEAAKLGASSGLLSTLYTQEKDALNHERQAVLDAQKQAEAERRRINDERRLDISERRADAAMTTAAAALARANLTSATADNDKLTPRQKSELKIIEDELKAARDNLSKALGATARKAAEERLALAEQKFQAFWGNVDGGTKPEPTKPEPPKPAEPKPLPLPPRSAGKEALKVGAVYQTPRGAAKWDGKQFILVN